MERIRIVMDINVERKRERKFSNSNSRNVELNSIYLHIQSIQARADIFARLCFKKIWLPPKAGKREGKVKIL